MVVIELEDNFGISSERHLVTIMEESYTDNARRVITARKR
ncbi:hypothetical protein M1M34_gp122 [Haloarcula tailed virus 2]|uniref:Uncharacterized protein n=1 Tax=Haloarcula tailed virus 2 TaxID=2877989 RepID=A0AAE8Y0L7_9CAUD|nr:hypothetical protein M1M34_gp122 [Haloarcula tailed virus 2]UBF23211.1 hypothetical protein HATV-2_gp60 [Haloarcula tailed virus 2]